MSIPPQSALPHLHSKPFYLNCIPDVLISNLVFSRHSHSKPQHSFLQLSFLPLVFFVTATVSSRYTIAGLTTELYTFAFTLFDKLLSQITPDAFLHPFHPACTLFFTTLSQLPFSCTVDPKYLNSFILGTFVSSIFAVSSSFSPFMHR